MSKPRSLSFGSKAALYDDSRPSYPLGAVEWVLGAQDVPEPRVVDLAAGTGKLTEVLVALGAHVIAVEPDEAMSAQIQEKLPHVEVKVGRDTAIPCESGSLDAVTVAQAWHWFDSQAASREIARVLRPGGVLGIMWNVYDERVAWVAEFVQLLRAGDTRDATRSAPVTTWGVVESAEFSWVWKRTPQQLVDLACSTSWVISLPLEQREKLSARIRELVSAHADPGTGLVELPYTTSVYRVVRPEHFS